MDISNLTRDGNQIILDDGYSAIIGQDGSIGTLKIFLNNRLIGQSSGSSLFFSDPLTEEDKEYLISLISDAIERPIATDSNGDPMELLLSTMKEAFIWSTTSPREIFVYYDKDRKTARCSQEYLVYEGEIRITSYEGDYERLTEEELKELGLTEEEALEDDWDYEFCEQAQNLIQSLIDDGTLDVTDFQ